MTDARCDCWKPSEPHGPTCPVPREAARQRAIADHRAWLTDEQRQRMGIPTRAATEEAIRHRDTRLAAIPERAEWDAPMGGWEPRT